MQTLKKKDIKKFKPKVKAEGEEIELEEIDTIDELVNGVGAGISGDEKNVNNSEIETSPQGTTDQHMSMAIQPNRYLFNVSAVGGNQTGQTTEAETKIAKDKALALLEDLGSDFNNNSVVDIKEFPSDLTRKMLDLVKSVKDNGLANDQNKVNTILNFIKTNISQNA